LRRWQRAYRAGRITLAEIGRRLQSWWGHAQHADAWRIASEILDRHPFTKAPFGPATDLPTPPENLPKKFLRLRRGRKRKVKREKGNKGTEG
jgi:hypothetical protein